MVLQWILGYMCLFQFWFPQSICLDVVLLGHMVTFHTYLFSYTVVSVFIHSVQSLSHVQLFETPWTAACQASLSMTKQHIKTHVHESCHAQTHVHWVGDAIHNLIFCHPLLLLPSIFPSIRVFSNESDLRIRWPKYWSFSFSISPSNEYSGLFSFRIDWFDLLAVQGTLKSLLQHHSSKASILQHSAFFIVQLLHPYMTTGKILSLTRRTLLTKWCLCFWICYLGWS